MIKKTFVLKASFLVLLAISAALSGVFTSSINKALKDALQHTVEKVEEETGIQVQYAHLSPAILWYISMTGLTLTNAQNGDELVSVRRITLRYNIYHIIKGDIDKAFSALSINGVDVNADTERDAELLHLLRNNLSLRGGDAEGGAGIGWPRTLIRENEQSNEQSIENAVRNVTQKLHMTVNMRKVSLYCKDKRGEAQMLFDRITLRRSRSGENLRFMASGDMSLRSVKPLQVVGEDVSARFNSDITLRPAIDGSTALFRLRDVSAGAVSMKAVNLLTHYADAVVTVQTIQTPLPLKAKCTIDAKEKHLDATVQTAKLPIRRVFSPRKGGRLDAAYDTVITMDSEVALDFDAKDTSVKAVVYHSAGSFTLPKRLTKSGDIQTDYSLMGDENEVRIGRLKVRGAKCSADGEMTYAFRQMQLVGTLNVNRVTLPNGTDVSAQLLFDKLERTAAGKEQKGAAIFSPKVTLRSDDAVASLNAVGIRVMSRGKSVDFSAEAYDYSHAEEGGGEGSIYASGSYLIDAKKGQNGQGNSLLASVTVGQYYLDSLVALQSAVAGRQARSLRIGGAPVMEKLHDFMFAGEAYISVDKNGAAYNVPYAIALNTKKENEAVYLSLDGSNDIINVSQFDVAYGKHGANITAHIERARDIGGAFFTLEAISSSGGAYSADSVTAVPYRFSGSVSGTRNERLITVSDDYGSMLQAVLHEEDVEGNLVMSSFPVRAGKGMLSVSTQTGFAWNKEDGIAINVTRFETVSTSKETGGIAPRFALSGEITKYGAFFDKLSYTDAFSALDGSATAFLNMNSGIFDSAKAQFNLSSPLSGESVAFDLDITNPDALPVTVENAKERFYFNLSAALKSFALSRFVKEKSENNALTATLDATGTFTNPYINVNISRASLMFASVPIVASGNASVIDKVITVADTKLSYGQINITDVGADFSLDTFTGGAQAMLDIGVDKTLFSMPMTFSVQDADVSPVTHLPLSFTASMETSGATGTFINEPLPFSLTVMRTENEVALFSSDNLGISGYLIDGGEVNITSMSDFLGFRISGKNDWENLDFNISDLNIDVASIVSRFNNNKFAMYKGVLTGGIHVGGIRSDPDFDGVLAVENADFSLLKVVPYHITGNLIPLSAEHSQIDIPEVELFESGKSVYCSGKIMFDRWMFDNLELYVRTPPGERAPALLDVEAATIEGDAAIDLVVGIDRNKNMDVTGSVNVENTRASVRATQVMNLSEVAKSEILNRRINIDVTMGTHVNVTIDPLLRALITPGSLVNFQMDEEADTFSIKGDVGIKSGDIAWFNRSFYLKDGTIRFNDNEDNFDPVVTIRAETRDKDDEGRDVKIMMTASNQPISRFSPRFSSVPVKSEAELRAMLGQIAVTNGEAASDVMLSMGDFAVAATVGRAVENSIRDLFNFDIFSIRTSALQNLIKTSIQSGTVNTEEGGGKVTYGNLLDNSTVYIGKYIGSVVYLDAMLHISYDEHKKDDIGTKDGISFQPEVGFELDAPFAGIRWSMAPDIDAMKQNMFMPITSVTLSWGFSF